MSFERFIAFKHLSQRKKTGFISLISMISVGGVGVGVMALIVVLAVMSGFDTQWKSKFVNVQPHLRIEKYGGIDHPRQEIERIRKVGIPGLSTATSFVEGQGIIRSKDAALGVIIKGIEPAAEDLSIYENHLIRGRIDFEDTVMLKPRKGFLFFKKPALEMRYGSVLIGEGLARRIGVRVGDQVSLITPFKEKTHSFSVGNAEVRTFIVKGVFRIGMSDIDSSLALMSVKQAQAMYHLGDKVSGIGLRFDDVDVAEEWKINLLRVFGPDYMMKTWYDLNSAFFQALKVEKSMMTILLALIILVATFNIVSTLTMTVMEKTKDIGILRAIGATRASIRKIFMIEGFSIGFMGVFFGGIAGVLMACNLNPIADFLKETTGFEVFPSDIYYFDKIPAEVHREDVILILAFAMLASILAGFYPAFRASRMKPIEALHYE